MDRETSDRYNRLEFFDAVIMRRGLLARVLLNVSATERRQNSQRPVYEAFKALQSSPSKLATQADKNVPQDITRTHVHKSSTWSRQQLGPRTSQTPIQRHLSLTRPESSTNTSHALCRFHLLYPFHLVTSRAQSSLSIIPFVIVADLFTVITALIMS